MLLKDNKKGLVTVIMKRLGDSKESSETYKGPELDNSSACEACAEKVIKAIDAKNPKMLSNALKEFFKLMEEEDDYMESESEEQE